MQNHQQPPTIIDSSSQEASRRNSSSLYSAANPLGLPTIYTEHCAAAADGAFERCAGQTMQSLSLPPPTSLPCTPFGRRQSPGNHLALLPSQFSPGRSEQYSYPSPPMSDSHSPAHRSAQIVEPEGHPYPPPLNEPRRMIGVAPHPPHASSMLDPRSTPPPHSIQQARPLYSREAQPRTQPIHYQQHVLDAPYGGMPISHNYTYGYPPPGIPSYMGNQGPGPQMQPSNMIPPPPSRQTKPARRTKAHVASACVNCKKAHLSCDVQRPCGRCVSSGKQDSCKDVQHKKRGRPRLRDDKEFGRNEDIRTTPTQAHTQLLGSLAVSSPNTYGQQPPFPTIHRVPEPHRVLKSTREEDIPNLRQQHPAPVTRGPHQRVGSYGMPYGATQNMTHQALPIAFLNLDLVVQKSNQSFQDLISFLGDVRGKSLAYFLENRQADVLQRLRTELRDERNEREPTYMAPITPVGYDPMQAAMQSVSERDVEQVSQGYTDRPFLLNFRLPNNQHQTLQTRIRLAKTSLYFVTLVVHTPPRPTGPPLLTQQLAPPTPNNTSQPMSAPTNPPNRDFASYSARPTSSASSVPTSPYFNFSTVRTSLPTISSSSYGSSPSYGYSPTAGPEQGYFPTYQPPLSQPGAYPSPYQPPSLSRTGSVTSEPQLQSQALRESVSRPDRLEGLQLPPLRKVPVGPGPPAPLLASPMAQEAGQDARDREQRVRRRESPSSAGSRPGTPGSGKRRRLNIHEVLE